MNRMQRRQLNKKGLDPSSIMNKYRQEAYEDGFKSGVKHSYGVILSLTAYTARLHFDLGKKRLPEFMNRLLMNIDSFRTGQLNPEDITAIEEENKEFGFDIGTLRK